MSEFDIEKFLIEVKTRQKQKIIPRAARASVDTESLFTDRNDQLPFHFYSKSHYYQPRAYTPIRVIHDSSKPYNVEDYFPKNPSTCSSIASSVRHAKENARSHTSCTPLSKKEWEEIHHTKDSNRNPLISIENRFSRSPSPYRTHDRHSTADFNINLVTNTKERQSKSPKTLEVTLLQQNSLSNETFASKLTQSLTVCTCILAGSLYLHKIGCKKVEVLVEKGKVKKRFGIVEAVVKIQREFRKFIMRKSLKKSGIKINLGIFSKVSNEKKNVYSSVLSSYVFAENSGSDRYTGLDSAMNTSLSETSSRMNSQKPEFLEKVLISGNVLKGYKNNPDESIDFDLSGTFK
ncbi:hypothetical protein SteCoe_15032 [Stentor coeruleus]|uniref:Uncharacterized protein n=1 Tax=Stentor coeruleus TaxID=5963 RepID=A0A1R2C4K0_9CILI|nr:hypothetical protein SteCoe_15032 [Stentor coeruleus]